MVKNIPTYTIMAEAKTYPIITVWTLSEIFQYLYKIRMRPVLYFPEWRALVTRRRYVTAIKDFHLPYLRSRVGGFYFSRVSTRTQVPLRTRKVFTRADRNRVGKHVAACCFNYNSTLKHFREISTLQPTDTFDQWISKNSILIIYNVNLYEGNVI